MEAVMCATVKGGNGDDGVMCCTDLSIHWGPLITVLTAATAAHANWLPEIMDVDIHSVSTDNPVTRECIASILLTRSSWLTDA